jgi:RNA-directed DNA polymerase
MKVLKSIYKVMGCAILAASLSSCVNDWLDVAPSDGTDAGAALTSSSDLAAARTGMYKALKGNSSLVDYYGQQFFVYGDVHAGDDYQYNNLGGSNRASFYYDMNYQTASEFTSSTSSSNVAWKSPYIVIGRANRIIAAAEGGALSDAAEAKATIDQYAAEAKVLRALAHFDLVRIYGKPYTEDQGASLGVPFDKEHLLERILSPDNLNQAYKAVVRNKGCGGIDKMSCEELLPWLLANKDSLIRSLQDGSYRPNPVRRVEIPKDNGKKRLLGIPTVVDRLVQQAINQTLTPIYERQFSSRSYGFRPRRGCHDALRGAQKIIDNGYIYVVDLDLERFFDTVSHSKLIEILSRTIKDGRVVSLIHKYLRSGVINKGLFEASEEGTPQGGPLSPLLSNIMLNELDKELERRGLPFVRYADDSMIFCKSKRAAMRVKESITKFIEGKLYLKVNKEKTVVSYVRGVKYLGYSFYVSKGKCQLTVHPKSKAKMKARLKELTSRSNGWGYAKRKQKLKEYIRGWVGYYHLANMKRLLQETDEWLRRRIRMCIWKSWKRVKTRIVNLVRCGMDKYRAYMWGNSRLGYWRIANSPILAKAIDNDSLRKAGYVTLMGSFLEWHPK